jgi:hypothetical protein
MNTDPNPRVKATVWLSQIRGTIIDKAKTRISLWKDKKISSKTEAPDMDESTTSSLCKLSLRSLIPAKYF